MHTLTRATLTAALFAMASLPAPADARIHERLPSAIRASFEKAYPRATIKHVGLEKDAGATVYEVESLDGTTKRDILYRPDGTVVEVEETLGESDVPGAVLEAAKSRYPKGKVQSIERITRRDAPLAYELHIRAGGRTHELKVDERGQPLAAPPDRAKASINKSGTSDQECDAVPGARAARHRDVADRASREVAGQAGQRARTQGVQYSANTSSR